MVVRHAPLLRLAALLLLAALVLHELRFRLDLGHGGEVAAHGHGYLALAAPVAGSLATLVLGALVLRSAVCPPEQQRRIRLRRVWPLAAAALLGIYTSQELVEGLVSHGHPSGLAGVFGAGGWVSIPLAIALGGGVALLVQVTQRVAEAAPVGAGWLEGIVARHSAPAPLRTLVSRTLGVRRRPLAFRLAGRGPPVLV
jgi:hypothetical protein